MAVSKESRKRWRRIKKKSLVMGIQKYMKIIHFTLI